MTNLLLLPNWKSIGLAFAFARYKTGSSGASRATVDSGQDFAEHGTEMVLVPRILASAHQIARFLLSVDALQAYSADVDLFGCGGWHARVIEQPGNAEKQ